MLTQGGIRTDSLASPRQRDYPTRSVYPAGRVHRINCPDNATVDVSGRT